MSAADIFVLLLVATAEAAEDRHDDGGVVWEGMRGAGFASANDCGSVRFGKVRKNFPGLIRLSSWMCARILTCCGRYIRVRIGTEESLRSFHE